MAKLFQGLAGLGRRKMLGQGGELGTSQWPACGQLGHATGRQQAGSKHPKGRRVVLRYGMTGERQKRNQDLGPSCPEEVLQRQPERI